MLRISCSNLHLWFPNHDFRVAIISYLLWRHGYCFSGTVNLWLCPLGVFILCRLPVKHTKCLERWEKTGICLGVSTSCLCMHACIHEYISQFGCFSTAFKKLWISQRFRKACESGSFLVMYLLCWCLCRTFLPVLRHWVCGHPGFQKKEKTIVSRMSDCWKFYIGI